MNDSIFISIASYRDINCSKTMESIFGNAQNPDRVFVGLCQQNDANVDEECSITEDKYRSNIRVIKLKHFEAKGPTWARYLCSTLWNNEKYFLQIDSHTLFSKNWDAELVDMIELLKSRGVDKPVLSHYPKSYETYDEDQNVDKSGSNIVTRMCKAFFNDRGMISFLGAQEMEIPKDTFIETAYMAAGMFFCESTFLQDIPFDPDLPFLFVGEEILHSARFWTSGWDIYTPSKNVLYHLYTRKDEPKIWTDQTYSDIPAFNKVKLIMGLDNNNDVPDYLTYNMNKYGMGKARTLAQYYEFCGIDLDKKTVSRDFCST